MGLESKLSTVFLARVADFLSGQSFPATKSELIGQARRANTASDVYATLLNLSDRSFGSMADVRQELVGNGPSSRT